MSNIADRTTAHYGTSDCMVKLIKPHFADEAYGSIYGILTYSRGRNGAQVRILKLPSTAQITAALKARLAKNIRQIEFAADITLFELRPYEIAKLSGKKYQPPTNLPINKTNRADYQLIKKNYSSATTAATIRTSAIQLALRRS